MDQKVVIEHRLRFKSKKGLAVSILILLLSVLSQPVFEPGARDAQDDSYRHAESRRS